LLLDRLCFSRDPGEPTDHCVTRAVGETGRYAAVEPFVKYEDGQDVRLWDRVEAWWGCPAIVVFSIDTDEYSPAFPREDWQYLERGVMLDTEQAGLVHLSEPDPDLVLLSRGGPPSDDEVRKLREAQHRHASLQSAPAGPMNGGGES